ncbi:MAG: hypothetical protein FJW35_13975 [Acidobacteria bacterium]|nr:hypothetical protein [Acidobacteriota bacterium]
MHDRLQGNELVRLIWKVFQPRPEDRALAILVDLPDGQAPDSPAWRERRRLAADWRCELRFMRAELGLDTRLYCYRNARANNADLPPMAWRYGNVAPPDTAEELKVDDAVPFTDVFDSHSILIAVTEFSATAPLKVLARKYGFRAATMPGFSSAMIPALRLDYGEIHRRVLFFKDLLDRAEGADLVFQVDGAGECRLELDLRRRTAHASSGLIPEPGTAANLPSGEAYIVPYEGEAPGEDSRTAGELPVQFGAEVVVYEIERNRARSVRGEGEAASREGDLLRREPAYGNIAELGLGVLADFGVQPCGSILLDEKLGLHIAFGRSDHFGGQVGPGRFSRPEAVVHIDRIYLPSLQPRIKVLRADLRFPGSEPVALIRDDRYVIRYGT